MLTIRPMGVNSLVSAAAIGSPLRLIVDRTERSALLKSSAIERTHIQDTEGIVSTDA